MRIVELLPSAWGRLAGTDLERICALLKAKDATARILIAEDENGRIVGHWGLFPVWHVEGCWVHEDYRGTTTVARPLIRAMKDLIASVGVQGVITASLEPTIQGYLERLGAEPLPGTALIWQPQKESACLPQS